MLIGHYTSSLIAKRIVPEIPLSLLFIAAQFVDIFWTIFVLEGLESFRLIPGFTASNPLDLYFMPYTHSLPAAFAWGLGLAVVLSLLSKRFRTKTTFITIILVVVSHWFLDLLVHVPDLPLWGNEYKQGFGLWHYRELSLALEFCLVLASTYYLSKGRIFLNQAKGLWILVSSMAAMQVFGTYGPAPESTTEVAVMALAAFLLFAYLAHLVELRIKGNTPNIKINHETL